MDNIMVEQERQEGQLRIFLTGEIDHHTAKTMREQIDQSIIDNPPTELVLDFKGVTFMDSSGIGLVMGRYKLMASVGGRVVVVNMTAHIKKIMKLAGLDQLAVMVDSNGRGLSHEDPK